MDNADPEEHDKNAPSANASAEQAEPQESKQPASVPRPVAEMNSALDFMLNEDLEEVEEEFSTDEDESE